MISSIDLLGHKWWRRKATEKPKPTALGLDCRQYLLQWIAGKDLEAAAGVFHACKPRKFGSLGGMAGPLETTD